MSTNVLLSVGLSAEILTKTVNRHRSAGSPRTGPGTADTETLCAAAEVLATRLATVEQFLSALQMIVGPTADLAAAVSAAVIPPPNEASARVCATLGLEAPVLFERPVFGHPDMTAVSHASIDEDRKTFSCYEYIVHRPTGTVHIVREEETAGETALRVESGAHLSGVSVHRDK